MKKYLKILLILFCSTACAQSKKLDLNSGKYLKNDHTNQLIGEWGGHASNIDVLFNISSEKRHIVRGALNFYADFLIIKTQKFNYKNKNITNKVSTNIELLAIDNNSIFSGTYKDPITGNNVKIVITVINNKELVLSSALPEIDFNNKPENGTVFPKEIKLTKE